MTNDDLPLSYVERPPQADRDGPAPAVVLIHGRGANERDLLPIADRLPDQLHVLSVRAPDRMGMGYTWYELDLSAGGLHASQPDPEGYRRSLDSLAEFVDAAIEKHDLDPDRVGLLGFSQGAILSLGSLVERPDRYAWVVALHGYLADSHADPDEVARAAGTPVFVGCGRDDQIIPADRARRAAKSLEDAGLDVTFEEYPVGHGTNAQEVADVAAWVGEQLE